MWLLTAGRGAALPPGKACDVKLCLTELYISLPHFCMHKSTAAAAKHTRHASAPGALKHAGLHHGGVDACHLVDAQRLQPGTAAADTACKER
jgi:hypothetical protein